MESVSHMLWAPARDNGERLFFPSGNQAVRWSGRVWHEGLFHKSDKISPPKQKNPWIWPPSTQGHHTGADVPTTNPLEFNLCGM
ncbi:hypothetical protein HUJ05_000775 [Dendroctonus ponderosae]|nr:hypothetical protein HUJ05_000775 [Dendroctonus ponderosae]